MEVATGSDGEKKKPPEVENKTKRKMKTTSQLEILEKTYAVEAYPSEALRVGGSAMEDWGNAKIDLSLLGTTKGLLCLLAQWVSLLAQWVCFVGFVNLDETLKVFVFVEGLCDLKL